MLERERERPGQGALPAGKAGTAVGAGLHCPPESSQEEMSRAAANFQSHKSRKAQFGHHKPISTSSPEMGVQRGDDPFPFKMLNICESI